VKRASPDNKESREGVGWTDLMLHLHAIKGHLTTIHGDERFLGRYWINATSGSTGHPSLFFFNRAEWTTVLASFARDREWVGTRIRLTRGDAPEHAPIATRASE
jgi:hypothetical protein